MSAKTDINVTPLIDIVLVLLIVFIVMVPGMSKQLSVVVPQVVKTDKPPEPLKNQPPPLVIEVDPTPDNTNYIYKFQSEAIDIAQIPERLVPVVQLQPVNMRKVFVKIDEEVPYQVAVQVLDQVRKASDVAKKESMSKLGTDGGDTKIAMSVKKRNP